MVSKVWDALRDPIRRRNVISRIIESLVGLVLVAIFGWWAIGLGVLAEFIYYEYLAEPLGWTGHYWERGPRDGETFTYW